MKAPNVELDMETGDEGSDDMGTEMKKRKVKKKSKKAKRSVGRGCAAKPLRQQSGFQDVGLIWGRVVVS